MTKLLAQSNLQHSLDNVIELLQNNQWFKLRIINTIKAQANIFNISIQHLSLLNSLVERVWLSINASSPNIHMQILLTVLHIFLMLLVGRI